MVLKVGIIRCQQTEAMCAGTTDFQVTSKGLAAFEETGPVEVVGFISCGGCPGKSSIVRAQGMVDSGAEAIVFASCITKGNPIGFGCPHYEQIKASVKRKIGERIKIIEWTH